jgi:hypothetical protein
VTARWPETLPYAQADSMGYGGPSYAEIIDVLNGPTRTRLVSRHATPTFEFEAWFSAEEAEEFEAWYNIVVAYHDGNWYAPWIGGARVLAFADEYQIVPLGTGWRVSGLLVQTGIDESLCDEHAIEVYGGALRDELFAVDTVHDELGAGPAYRDDYDPELILWEEC